jgi:hypothetical protein
MPLLDPSDDHLARLQANAKEAASAVLRTVDGADRGFQWCAVPFAAAL